MHFEVSQVMDDERDRHAVTADLFTQDVFFCFFTHKGAAVSAEAQVVPVSVDDNSFKRSIQVNSCEQDFLLLSRP